jgi:hypothetical protein
MSTRADSTRGCGAKTVAGTRPTTNALAQYATFADTAPYPWSPDPAASRFALHHHQHPVDGSHAVE